MKCVKLLLPSWNYSKHSRRAWLALFSVARRTKNSAVNLHVFSDSPEAVAMQLAEFGISYGPYERRLKTHRGRGATPDTFPGYRFEYEGATVEATVFPVDGIRQAPISPIDGKPMRRADRKNVENLIEPVSGMFIEGSKAQRSEPPSGGVKT